MSDQHLWDAYQKDRSIENRNALVEYHMPLAWRIAKCRSRKTHWLIEDGEVYSVAMLTLIVAVEKFDPSRGVMFSTYVWRSIHRRITRAMRTAAKSRVVKHCGTPYSSYRGTDAVDDRDELDRVLKNLSPKERGSLYKRFGLGVTATEIGAHPSHYYNKARFTLEKLQKALWIV